MNTSIPSWLLSVFRRPKTVQNSSAAENHYLVNSDDGINASHGFDAEQKVCNHSRISIAQNLRNAERNRSGAVEDYNAPIGTDPNLSEPVLYGSVDVQMTEYGDFYNFFMSENGTIFKADAPSASGPLFFNVSAELPLDPRTVSITPSEANPGYFDVSDGTKSFTLSGFDKLEFDTVSESSFGGLGGVALLGDDGKWTINDLEISA